LFISDGVDQALANMPCNGCKPPALDSDFNR
jgi:hypothetical protein